VAKVKIKVPNIGEIEAENFATEETLLRLVAAVTKSEKDKKAAENAALKKAQEDEIRALKLFNKTHKELNDVEKKQLEEEKKREAERAAAAKRSTEMWEHIGSSLATTFGSLGKTALSLATQMATQYDAMAQDPIGAAAGQLSTFIDATNTAAKGAVDLSTGILGSIPYLGGFAEGLDKAAKAALDLAAQLAKTANEVFAKEFKKSTEALASYTKQGASFAGGMNEMRQVANDAGISLKMLSDATAKSSEDIRAAGLTQGDGAKMIANGMSAMTKKFGSATVSARDELLALGYSYQDQAELLASYGAQVKATGRDMKNIAPEQLQREMKDYAVNLKVISDITGQDAKKLMDKARQESMRGALMGKLDSKQQEAYKNAYSTMMAMGPEMGPKLQQALTQVMAGGPVTDPIIAGNKDIMDMIRKTAGQVSEGNADMVVNTQKNLGEAGKAMKDHGENATDQAALFGGAVDGVVSGMAQMQNAFKSFQLDPEAAENSKKAATAQMDMAKSAGSVEQGFARVTEATTKAAVAMETEVGKHLDKYASLISYTTEQTVAMFTKGLKAIDDLIGGGKKADLAPSKPKATTAGNTEIGSRAQLDSEEVKNAKAALADKEHPLSDNDRKYFENLLKNQHSKGGISNTPGIFAEDGPEAAVPLPDGKTIPVTLKDISGSKKDDAQAKLLEKVTSEQENSLKLITNAQADIAKLSESSIVSMRNIFDNSTNKTSSDKNDLMSLAQSSIATVKGMFDLNSNDKDSIATLAQSSIATVKGMFDLNSNDKDSIATLAQSSIDSVKNMSNSSMQNMLESNTYSKDNLISFAQASIASMKNMPITDDTDKKFMEAQMASYAELRSTSKFLMDEASGRNNSIAVQTNVNQKTLDAIQALVDVAGKMARDNPEMKKQYDKEEENMLKQTAANKTAFDKLLNGDSNDDEKHNELLSKFDEMISHLRDGNDTTKKLLNVSS